MKVRAQMADLKSIKMESNSFLTKRKDKYYKNESS